MPKNLGLPDQIARSIFGLVLLGVAFARAIPVTWSWLFGLVAVYMLVTAGLGYCPLYRALDFSTNRRSRV